MAKQTLHQLLDGIVENPGKSSRDIAVNGISCDSREAGEGTVFVAIKGYETDGHKYINDAVRQGAAALIVERKPDTVVDIPVIEVVNSRKTLALLASKFYEYPADSMTMIGVTGTNGKTTVTSLLESVFLTAGQMTGMMGTLVYRWKEREIKAVRTTPDSVSLQRLLAHMRDDGVETVVMEVSSHALALDRVTGIPFLGAVFTNLSRDHLNFHYTMDAYANAKALLFSLLDKEGFGLLNADDEASGIIASYVAGKCRKYGFDKKADYRIKRFWQESDITRIELETPEMTDILETKLFGRFNVMNCSAAAAAALEAGVPFDKVKEGIRRIESVPGRMQWFNAPGKFRVIVDYAHTPDALENVINALKPAGYRLICLIGCGGDRDKGKRREMGQIAALLCDHVIITSDNPRTEDPQTIINEILDGIAPYDRKHVKVIPDRREAIEYGVRTARQGDSLLLAGKGHETYQEIKGRRTPFDDYAIARELSGAEMI